MLLIISEITDLSTNDVIDWLIETKQFFIRANRFDLQVKSVDYKESKINFTYNTKDLNNKQIKSYWYRRGYIDANSNVNLSNSKFDDHIFTI